MTNKEWFREAQYGMMAHFGLYSLLNGEWNGKRTPYHYGEWVQSAFAIPNAEYAKLTNAFNPVFFNADEWIKLAKDAGMKYFVFTSKHHDGFAMYHSKVDKYNVVDSTQFGRDIVYELAEACAKYGIKLGLYYSQDLDWHEMHGGGYKSSGGCSGVSWDNSWDFPDKSIKDYSICFENKIKPQVKEILTGYGELCLIWFDVPKTISAQQSDELYNMVKSYQPDCLLNSRIGNGKGDYTSTGDNVIPSDVKTTLYEVPATINDTWGFLGYDTNWKSAEKIAELRKHINERGMNYLLNVGPDGLGRIPVPSADVLLKAADLMENI